jgi:hypothetical protein
MPPKLKITKPKVPPKPRSPRLKKENPPKEEVSQIAELPQQKQSYKELIYNIVKSDYIRHLPQAIASIVITGLLTKYVLFGSNRTDPTNTENQAIDDLTSNVMHDLFFEEVNNRQIVNNLATGLEGLASTDDADRWLTFYVDPNKGEWV